MVKLCCTSISSGPSLARPIVQRPARVVVPPIPPSVQHGRVPCTMRASTWPPYCRSPRALGDHRQISAAACRRRRNSRRFLHRGASFRTPARCSDSAKKTRNLSATRNRRSDGSRSLPGQRPARASQRERRSRARQARASRTRAARRRGSRPCSASTSTPRTPARHAGRCNTSSTRAARRRSRTSSGRRCSTCRRASSPATAAFAREIARSCAEQEVAGAAARAHRAPDHAPRPRREDPPLSLRAVDPGEMGRAARALHARVLAPDRAARAASPTPTGDTTTIEHEFLMRADPAARQLRQPDAEARRMGGEPPRRMVPAAAAHAGTVVRHVVLRRPRQPRPACAAARRRRSRVACCSSTRVRCTRC